MIFLKNEKTALCRPTGLHVTDSRDKPLLTNIHNISIAKAPLIHKQKFDFCLCMCEQKLFLGGYAYGQRKRLQGNSTKSGI